MDEVEPFEQVGDANQGLLAERLRKREEARLIKVSKPETDEKKEKKGFENDFQQLLSQIKMRLENVDQLASDRNALLNTFENVRKETQTLHRMMAEAVSFLTTYDKRAANEALSALQDVIQSKEESLLPKKKFTFKSRKKESEKQSVVETSPQKPAMVYESLAMSISVSDMEDQTLVKQPEDVNGKDVELSRLTNCTVRIYGYPSTVHMTSLKNCQVYLGPVSTSVFVDGCESGKFTLACQQLRVHSTRDVVFCVHITSRSIIEECSAIRFAKYDWSYEHLNDHFQESGLNQNINNWKLVDDFNWLSSDVPSPNWSILENAEVGIKQD